MSKQDMALPIIDIIKPAYDHPKDKTKEVVYDQFGLTKRELFAALAMNAFCAQYGWRVSPTETTKQAVEYADALINALNAPKPSE